MPKIFPSLTPQTNQDKKTNFILYKFSGNYFPRHGITTPNTGIFFNSFESKAIEGVLTYMNDPELPARVLNSFTKIHY